MKGVERRAQIFSDVFCPLLVPTYGMAVAMWVTPLRVLPEKARLLATLLIAIITGLAPLCFIVALKKVGLVSDNSLSDRRQRPAPMIVTMICYIGAGLFLSSASSPLWLQLFFYGAAVATLIATLITLRWKISAHAIALGGLEGMLLWLAVGSLSDVNPMVLLTIGLVIAGGVGTSRLLLNRHTLAQVVAGFFLGLVCTFFSTMFFYL